MGWAYGTYGRQERCVRWFWWGNLRERDRCEYLGIEGKTMLKWTFENWDGEAWIGLIWVRVGTGDGRAWMREWTVGFHNMEGIFLTRWGTVSFSGRTVLHEVSYPIFLKGLFTWLLVLPRKCLVSLQVTAYVHLLAVVECLILSWNVRMYL
jgi:hypothetical protein